MSTCHAVPIRQLEAYSAVCAGLPDAPVTPKWVKKVQVFYNVPKYLELVNEVLSDERMARLSPEEAQRLHKALLPAHIAISNALEEWSPGPALRLFLRGWKKRVDEETARLGDIVEALAWGSDPELRQFVETEVGRLESQIR